MLQDVIHYSLLISCPSDITDEVSLIKESIERFNENLSGVFHTEVNVKFWKQSSYPESGGKPQALLDKQIVEKCDAAVAIFWTRFGTPTEKYGSGTEEEVEWMLAANRQVFMYFSDKPLAPSKLDIRQFQKVRSFKKRYRDKGLCYVYSTNSEFQKHFESHLIKRLTEVKNNWNLFLRGLPADETLLPLTVIRQTYRLLSSMPVAKDILPGRDALIGQIHDILNNQSHVLFLKGHGGIGKSELAKKYAAVYRREYAEILFLTFTSSLEDLICNPEAIQIENLSIEQNEDQSAFFDRKLHLLKTLSSEKTLLIIDNFDVEQDKRLEELLTGNYRIIFTTRLDHPGYHSLEIEAVQDKEAIYSIFAENYPGEISESDRYYLNDIFSLVEYHTYTIVLIARQMAAGHISSRKMLEFIKKNQIHAVIPERNVDLGASQSAFQHLSFLLDVNYFNDDEQKILMYLSLMGVHGVLEVYFKSWIEPLPYDVVEQLIQRGWVRRETGARLSLHSLAIQVVLDKLSPSIDNCRKFLNHIMEFCCGAWLRTYRENWKVLNNVMAVLRIFEPIAQELRIFEPWISFLWQVGKFEESIHCFQALYSSCLKEFGENVL